RRRGIDAERGAQTPLSGVETTAARISRGLWLATRVAAKSPAGRRRTCSAQLTGPIERRLLVRDASEFLFVAALSFPAASDVPIAGAENLPSVVHGSKTAARRLVHTGAHSSVLITRRTVAARIHTPTFVASVMKGVKRTLLLSTRTTR